MDILNIDITAGILIIVGILIVIALCVKAGQNEIELKRYKEQEKQRELRQQEIYYRNRDYKAKDSRFYLMTPKEKLEYTYDSLPEKEQEKVLTYAENLLKQIENQKYNK